MPYRLEFEIPMLPRMQNPSGRGTHWRILHKEKEEIFDLVAKLTAGRRPSRPLSRARLVLTRHSSVRPDPDGLVSGFKRVVDGMKACGILVDDKNANIDFPMYLWSKAAPGKGKVHVLVEEIE